MKTKFLTLAVFASALSLSACGGGETGAAPSGDKLPKVAAPAGKAWSDSVIKTPEGGYKMGNADAKLQLVEYGAITCPGCAQFSVQSTEELKAMVDSGVVAFEYRPYLVHGIQDIPGFLLAQCNGPEAYFGLIDQLYANQSEWLGKLQTVKQEEYAAVQAQPPAAQITFLADKMGLVEFVKARGVSEDAAKICLADAKELDAMVKQTEKASKDEDVSGTPALFLNGKRFETGSWKEVKVALKNAGAR
jgi:protein-disulfide isomerase